MLEHNASRPYEVLSEGTAATMTSLLQSVMDHGTGFPARAAGFTIPAAGKTGMTATTYRHEASGLPRRTVTDPTRNIM